MGYFLLFQRGSQDDATATVAAPTANESGFVRGHVTRQTAPADVKRSRHKRDVSKRPLSVVSNSDGLHFIDDVEEETDDVAHETSTETPDDSKRERNDVISASTKQHSDKGPQKTQTTQRRGPVS